MINRNLFVLAFFSFLIFAGLGVAVEQQKPSEKTSKETAQPELPPAIQQLLQKEMEKLPPVERHFRMAQDFNARGKYDEAMKELELALREDSRHVPSCCELGIVYMGKGEYDKAIVQLNRALEMDSQYPKTHYALANAYARRANPDIILARQHLDQAVKLGYHAVPWFVEYLSKLEKQNAPQAVQNKEKVTTEASGK